jgi:glycosyltransferase involved in cell wall biosynthesis
MSALRPPRIALVHDWLVSPGGAEATLYELHQMWPEAPIFTAAYSPEKFPEFANADVRPTWLNRIALAKKKHQLFSIPRAWAFKSLNLSDYDVVISSASAESKYVRTGPQTLHICYCHTPIRYYWSDYDWYRQHPPFGPLNPLAKVVLPLLIGGLRGMDYRAAQRVDQYIANSENVRQRIERYYHRGATVIHPPIRTDLFTLPRRPQDYYVIVGRQVAYKRLDLAVDAFNELGLPLKVAGAGEEIARQRPRAKANIEFLGRVSDAERARLFAGARGFIFPPEEDFGMTPIEAMAAGCPVIAYGKGGALEYVKEGETGTLFAQQTPTELVAAVRRFETMQFDEATIRAWAKTFDASVFRQRISEFVAEQWAAFEARRS